MKEKEEESRLIDMERKSYINPVNDNDLSIIIPELICKISQKQKLVNKLSSEIEDDKKQIILSLSNAKQIGYTGNLCMEECNLILYMLKADHRKE